MSKLSLDMTAAVGAKRTVSVQLAAGFTTWFEQLSFRMLNGAPSMLPATMSPMVSVALPSFVIVTV